MRTLLAALVAVTILYGPTVNAQAHARASAGFDDGYQAPSVGIALEATLPAPRSSVTAGVRISGDVVLTDRLPYGRAFAGDGRAGVEADVYRLGLEAIVYGARVRGLRPYGKAGIVSEFVQVPIDIAASAGWTDAVAGLGLEVGRLYIEGTHGFGDVSRRRLAVGIQF